MRNSGKSYVTKKGVQKPAKIMKIACGYKCRNKCTCTYTHGDREELFHSFWKHADINKQRQFTAKNTVKNPKRLTTGRSNRRKSSLTWYIPSPNDHNKKVKVCKTFFLNTLGISDNMVTTVHNKLNLIGMCMDDRRG